MKRFWPEVSYSGSSGQPANAGEEVRRFGSAPLYLATGEWCGMGSCSDDIAVISLARSEPRLLGDVLGGASFAAGDLFPDNDDFPCEDYAYTARIGPPTTANGIFSVTYDGWTAPPKARTTKTRFRLTADAVPEGNNLALRPKIHVPDCGR